MAAKTKPRTKKQPHPAKKRAAKKAAKAKSSTKGKRARKPPPQTSKSVVRRSRAELQLQKQADSILAIAGKPMIQDALAHDGSKEAIMLSERLSDPHYADLSFPVLCQTVKLAASDVVDMVREYKTSAGLLEVYKKTPEVLSGLATDAAPKRVPCPACEGFLTIAMKEGPSIACPACMDDSGTPTGFITMSGDRDAQKMVLDILQLAGKSPMVAIQNNYPGRGGQSQGSEMPSMDDFVTSTDQIAEKSGVIEATLVES